jgi:hypothetical protein
MANRIPLVVVSTEQLIKELPAVDDLDLSNSSIRNVATANVGNINTTNLIVTTANATTINTTSLVVTTANVTTANLSSLTVFGGTTSLEEVIEKANVTASAMGANVNFDVLDCAVQYYTANSTANSTLNIRGNSTVSLNTVMAANQSLTVVFSITNNSSAYRVANLQIDGTSVTPKWSGGSAPTASANSVDAYSFTVIKTGSAAYTVLGSKTQFA